MKLTNEEYNLINKLTNKAKVDWFEIRTSKDGCDYIVDIEDDEVYSLSDGLLLLDECLTELSDYMLTEDERNAYSKLIHNMKVYDALSKERLIALLYNSLTILEEANLACLCLKNSKLQEEIGITDEEYDYIMSETPNEDDYFEDEEITNTPAERRKIEDIKPDAHKN